MSNFKNLKEVIRTNVKSIQSDFPTESSEIGSSQDKNKLSQVDFSKVPKEQRDKLESYIKQWENPSNWYECRIQGLERFLNVAQQNNVSPEAIEFVIENTSDKKPIIKPIVKHEDVSTETNPQLDDLDRLRRFLKLYPKYKTRVENGENVADMAISIIKSNIEKEKRRNLGLDN